MPMVPALLLAGDPALIPACEPEEFALRVPADGDLVHVHRIVLSGLSPERIRLFPNSCSGIIGE